MKEAACIVSISPLRAEPSDKAEMVSQLLFGDCVQVVEINHPWAEVIVLDDNYRGFVDIKHLIMLSSKEFRRWNEALDYVYSRELLIIPETGGKMYIPRGSRIPAGLDTFNIGDLKFDVNDSNSSSTNDIFSLAQEYQNTPYLWGGKTPFGIDCSGFTQIVYRICGYNLPRDAYEQVDVGNEIPFEEKQPGDLAFFINSSDRVHHVGIVGPNDSILHASGHVRTDTLTIQGIYRSDRDEITHKLHRIIRI
ncbi:MAG: hydrolase Nlp/P60 [Bacteroidetes bacterium]|nr:MAG: hydrolase Nlp/P60 [Bacteroidota bacterium]